MQKLKSRECKFCNRPLVLSTSNRNKGQYVKCLCRHREALRVRLLEQRRKNGKQQRSEYPSGDAWHAARKTKDKRSNQEYCENRRKREKEYYGARPERRKDYFRKHMYGLAYGEYQRMLKEQKGKCFLCFHKMARPHIDHCHDSNKTRHLLCGGCNMAVGIIETNLLWLERVKQYLNI